MVLCTLNPRLDVLRWVLDGLQYQTLSPQLFDLVLVDNGSKPPLAAQNSNLENVTVTRLIENTPGLTAARLCGIQHARGAVIAFLDDDTRPDPDYLERAVHLATTNNDIGCFGGRVRAKFEAEPAKWLTPLLGYLTIRDFGPDPIRKHLTQSEPWEPIGVMIARREVAERFAEWVRSDPEAQGLGRKGASAMSGEDTLITRSAALCGFGCAYEPELGCDHWLPPRRLTLKALARLLLGMGRSHAKLARICTPEIREPSWPRAVLTLFGALWNRLRHSGPVAGPVEWLFDWGWMLERKRR